MGGRENSGKKKKAELQADTEGTDVRKKGRSHDSLGNIYININGLI